MHFAKAESQLFRPGEGSGRRVERAAPPGTGFPPRRSHPVVILPSPGKLQEALSGISLPLFYVPAAMNMKQTMLSP